VCSVHVPSVHRVISCAEISVIPKALYLIPSARSGSCGRLALRLIRFFDRAVGRLYAYHDRLTPMEFGSVLTG